MAFTPILQPPAKSPFDSFSQIALLHCSEPVSRCQPYLELQGLQVVACLLLPLISYYSYLSCSYLRAFAFDVSSVWNALPPQIYLTFSITSFRSLTSHTHFIWGGFPSFYHSLFPHTASLFFPCVLFSIIVHTFISRVWCLYCSCLCRAIPSHHPSGV